MLGAEKDCGVITLDGSSAPQSCLLTALSGVGERIGRAEIRKVTGSDRIQFNK